MVTRLFLLPLLLALSIFEETTGWQVEVNSNGIHRNGRFHPRAQRHGTHPVSSKSRTSLSVSNLGDNDNLAFVPKKVMSKFLSSIGGPIASSSLQAGYQAGVVTDEELEDVRANLDLDTTLLDDDAIQLKWKDALQDQPWHIQTMGSMASGLVVGIVSNLQTKLQAQAEQMKWINENALPIIQANQTVVDILGGAPLFLNNTRAKYESDRDVWSASMDVLGGQQGTLSVSDTAAPVGLVNVYFTPSEDIKILVVEIDDVMHNLTWKGLS